MWKFPLRVFLTYFYYIFGPNLGVYRHLHYLCNFCLLVMCECAQMASKLLINENWSQISHNEIGTYSGQGFLHFSPQFSLLSPHTTTHSLGVLEQLTTPSHLSIKGVGSELAITNKELSKLFLDYRCGPSSNFNKWHGLISAPSEHQSTFFMSLASSQAQLLKIPTLS